MNLFNEYALLIVVAVPVLTIVGINIFLALSGDVENLLLPFVRDYPRIETPADVAEPKLEATAMSREPMASVPLRKAA